MNDIGGNNAYRKDTAHIRKLINSRLDETFQKFLNRRYNGELAGYINNIIAAATANNSRLP